MTEMAKGAVHSGQGQCHGESPLSRHKTSTHFFITTSLDFFIVVFFILIMYNIP